MKIIVAGGTGFIGSALVDRLARKGHALTVLTRIKKTLMPGATPLVWQPGVSGEWRRDLEATLADADGVINLAGESIAAGRWSKARKDQLRLSRIESTRALVDAIAGARGRPKFLINGSAVGYYGPRADEPINEAEHPGSDFLARLCVEWEAEARRAEALEVRVVLLRTGIVLGRGGGALAKMVPPFKFFVGGPLGSGAQWMPWIHLDDEVGLIDFLVEASARGAVNATAPEPVTMKEFCAALGKVMRRPCWAPVPAFVLRAALGEMADMLLTGQRAVPAAAEKLGYRFRFSKLSDALRDILS